MFTNISESPFHRYLSNVYSQNGEDGVIKEIFNRLGWESLSFWAVEFGAWDGRHLSNTFSLVENSGFSAIYIEGNPKKYSELLKTSSLFPGIRPLQAMVIADKLNENSLDKLLSRTEVPEDFDILSIDIDSFDLDIWESVEIYKPKVVVIEINSGIMPGILSRHNQLHDGNSFSSTLLVAEKKGYYLVCHTGNCIFVRSELVAALNIETRYLEYPELLFQYQEKWMPAKISFLRLVLRKVLPRKIKYFLMRSYELLRVRLSQ